MIRWREDQWAFQAKVMASGRLYQRHWREHGEKVLDFRSKLEGRAKKIDMICEVKTGVRVIKDFYPKKWKDEVAINQVWKECRKNKCVWEQKEFDLCLLLLESWVASNLWFFYSSFRNWDGSKLGLVSC